MRSRVLCALALAALTAVLSTGPAAATELTLWAHQADLRAAAGDPNTPLSPAALAHNPADGTLLVACGGSNASILEWSRDGTVGTLLVPRANWGAGGSPAPFAAAYVPARGTWLVASGGDDDAILEVTPGSAGQTPPTYLATVPPTFPAGGLVQDGAYGYYKNQWTGVQQTVNRFPLAGPPVVEEEYVPATALAAWNLAGPSQQLAMDSAGTLYLSGRPIAGGGDEWRGIYRWDEAAAALVRVLTFAEIAAFTGESNLGIYGMTFDAEDALYFYDIYSASILRRDRFGRLSTFLRNDEVRDFFDDPDMQVHPSYMQVVGAELVFLTGNISGHIVGARLPVAEADLVLVPGTDYEVDGPTYPYRIGRYEITNAQYCTFLNDAERVRQADPDDPRCSHVWIDAANGDVYMTDVSDIPIGSERYDRTLYKTSDLPDSKIKYDLTQAPGSRFYVLPGFAHHPVGTVSWFGAAKFCNWLTIHSGLPPEERCYREGTTKNDWYAITASDWANNGLLPEERFVLVRQYRGYRLPMDGVNEDYGGPGVAHSWNITANPYNEWYKAAAFDPNAPDVERPGPGDGELVPPNHWTFGFGADSFTPADANLVGGDAPFLETTPVGWYDGVNLLASGTPTRDTRNRYSLHDLSGNVAEWINDTALEYPWSSTYRGTRGGAYSSDPAYATTSFRNITTARYYAENRLGFRVLRTTGYGDFDGDDGIGPPDLLFLLAAVSGPDVAVPPGQGHEACDANGDGDVDMTDVAAFQRAYGQ